VAEDKDIRWKQRFQNFDRAVVLLREPIERGLASLSTLEKEGTIQRFEFCLELAWKTVKDFLEYEGRSIQPVTPRTVFKEAFAAGVIKDGTVWLEMLDHRNLLSHTYDVAAFEKAVLAIKERYQPAIEALHEYLLLKRMQP
jgi:nucleotidyltransferase substrate binding protein (TIGR01987 family)